MNIKELIKENYKIAKSKGFYPDDSKTEDHLMGIVSEIGEAYEAHRGGKFANKEDLEQVLRFIENDSKTGLVIHYQYLSGTFEDELADAGIRLLNYSGHTGCPIIIKEDPYNFDFENISNSLMLISRYIISRQISNAFNFLYKFCIYHNIDIEKHILAKMEYNKTREHLHGKKY